jgi:hypothetical protein
MTMMMRSLARKGAIALCAVAVLAMMSGSGSARWHGCWGCGAFVAGAIAGAAIAAPYNPPRYYYTAPVVAHPPVRGDACAGSGRRNDALPCLPGIRPAALLLR